MREAINVLFPKLKHMLLECLSKENFHFCGSGDNHSTRNKYVEYLEFLLGWNHVSRRHLAGQDLDIVSHALGRASPLDPASAPASGSEAQPPTIAPAPSSGPEPTPAHKSVIPDPDPKDFLQPTSPDRPTEPIETGHDSPPVLPTENQNNSTDQNSNKKTVIVAVVVTAAGTSLIAAFIFCCCFGCLRNKDDLENGQKDDRPLLALSRSDFSGSSHKSFGLASSINNDRFGSLSFKSDPSQNGHVDNSDDTPPSGALSGISSSIELSSAPIIAPESRPVSSSSTDLSVAPNITPAPTPPPPPMMPPIKKVASPPVPPPPVPNLRAGPRPPPPPKSSLPPRASKPIPPPSRKLGNAVSGQQLDVDSDNNAHRTKLKPFFWDKVSANSDQAMVWHEIKSGSFQFNEEMIETLFGYNSTDKLKNANKKESTSKDPSPQFILILEPKKSQNLAISLKALNVKIEEVCEALLEGNELPADLLQSLLRMAPTTDEELKLRLYTGDRSLLGPAERFLRAMVDIPFAFKRMDALLFMSSLEEDTSSIRESFATLEVASQELRNNRLFLKLLEAVLKTGNRMNDGTFRGGAQAFKLDTLLKLADVKGTDGKTTLLHFVVQEIIRSEGVRAVRMARESGSLSSLTTISSLNSEDFVEDSPQETGDHYRNLGLKVVSGVSSELGNVKKAAGLDADAITSTVATIGHRLVRTKEFLNTDMKTLGEDSGFHNVLRCFVEHAEVDVTSLLEEEKRVRSLVKSTTDYFHGNAGKDEGLRMFVVVRDFLGMLDKVCKEVRESSKKVQKLPKAREPKKMAPVPDPRQLLFPAIRDRRMDHSSSDEE